jgi:hypothetical protein
MTLTREKIIKQFTDKNYEIIPLDKSVPNHDNDTLFVIKGSNLIYFTDFKLDYRDEYSKYYNVMGDLFFVTPTGTLSNDFILNVDALIFPEEYDDMFIVRCEDSVYDEIDNMIILGNTVSFKNVEIELL